MSKLQLNAETVKLAEVIRSNHEQGKKPEIHNCTVDLFNGEYLPEGLSPEQVKLYRDHAHNASSAVALVAGEIAIEDFKGDKDLQKSYLYAKSGSEETKVQHTRYVSGTTQLGDQAQTWETYCSPTITVKTSANSKKSQIARIFADTKEKGKAALS